MPCTATTSYTYCCRTTSYTYCCRTPSYTYYYENYYRLLLMTPTSDDISTADFFSTQKYSNHCLLLTTFTRTETLHVKRTGWSLS